MVTSTRPNRVSPGISTFERDITLRASAPSAFAGGIVGKFAWGPADEAILVGTEEAQIEAFGSPTDDNAQDWHNASEFLAQAGALYIARTVSDDAYNATQGGAGAGLTVDTTVVNGAITVAAINAAGANYIVGDVVYVTGGATEAQLRVTAVDSTGAVTAVTIKAAGVGVVAAVGVATTIRNDFQIKNDDDREATTQTLPDIMAKYPGSQGNSFGVAVVRGSEYNGWTYAANFAKSPDGYAAAFDGDGATAAFTVDAKFSGGAGQIVTVGNSPITAGVLPGQYALAGNVLTIVSDAEQFTGDNLTDAFTVVNANSLDLSKAVVTQNTVNLIRTTASGSVAAGYFRLDSSGALTIGTEHAVMSADGVTAIWSITTADTLTIADTKVFVDGVAQTLDNVAPTAAGEVEIAAIAGGYSFNFFAVPASGNGNIEVQWGFPDTTANGIEVTMGLPNGTNDLRVFADQTNVHAVVWDTDTGDVLEVYTNLSLSSTETFDSGLTAYYVDSITNRSQYVAINQALSTFGDFNLTGGTDGSALTADYQNTYNAVFGNKNDLSIAYLVDQGIDSSLALSLLQIAETRGDCVAFIQAPVGNTLQNSNALNDVNDYFDTLTSTSYGFACPQYQKIYDRHSAKYRWVPTAGVIAGLHAQTHEANDWWTAAAGYRRGLLRRAQALSWTPTEAQADALYANNVNFVINDKSAGGFVLLGQKSMLRRESAFNRINVRFLGNYARAGAQNALKDTLMEVNTESTRAAVRNVLNPFFRDIQSREGVYAYEVKCDGENNTATIIDANELVVSCYLQPTRTIEKIGLNLIYTQTGVNFEELQ